MKRSFDIDLFNNLHMCDKMGFWNLLQQLKYGQWRGFVKYSVYYHNLQMFDEGKLLKLIIES